MTSQYSADPPRGRIVLVLGMHRSGTSALTRGLQVLSVDLGNDLIGPISNNNEKGFWEDAEINAFNESLLAKLDSGWHRLGLIDPTTLLRPECRIEQEHAVELLRRKISGRGLFAFKDPRTAILLPFWQAILAELRLSASYIVAVRNPLEVAASLEKRDSFAKTKALILWAKHVVAAVQHTNGLPRIFVDYHSLCRSPYDQLVRIARTLELPRPEPSSERFVEYARDFLTPALRHNVAAEEELAAPDEVPPLVADLYRFLRELSEDEARSAGPSFSRRWKNLKRRYQEFVSVMAFIDTLESERDHLTQEGRSLHDSLVVALNDVKRSDAARNQLEERLETVNQALDELKNDHAAALRAERDASLEQLSALREELEHTSNQYLAAAGQLESEMHQGSLAREQLSKAGEKLDHLEHELQRLGRTHAAAQARLSETEDRLEHSDQELERMARANLLMRERLGATQDELEGAGQERDRLSRVNDLIRERLAETENRLELSAQESERAARADGLLRQRLGETEQRLARSEEQLQAAVRVRTATEEGLAETRNELARSEEALEKLREANTLVQEWLAVAEEKLESREKELQESRREKAQGRQRLAATERQLGQARERHRVSTLKLQTIARQKAALQEQLSESNEEKDQLARDLTRYYGDLEAMVESRSWKMTAPLRYLFRLPGELVSLEKTESRIEPALRWLYRHMPISADKRMRLKHRLFSRAPGFVRGTSAYRFWAWQEEQKSKLALDSEASYEELSAWIASSKRNRIQAVTPRALPTVDFSSADLREKAHSLRFAVDESPTVSIVIPVHNNVRLTLECLWSLENTENSVPFEVIVVDDGSTDATGELIPHVTGIKYARNEENLGFVRTCNRGAELAVGEFVLFLNNDVQATDRWLDELFLAFESRPDVGAVGPKIVYPQGRLQEAGAALNSDLSSTLVGVAEDRDSPAYSFSRTVDYCSGTCLMLKRALFRQLEGFDRRLAPSYCEDVDLCLRISEQGKEILYVADSVIVHHLSATSNSLDPRYKKWWVVNNQQKLAERWQSRIDALSEVRLICFYLPQFHPIPENDRWWGRGFVEWTNVRKARPSFGGHFQPVLPTDLGFYDLRESGVMQAQADLARRYGIYGFCYYYYWFGGKRLLEAPIETMLSTGEPDMPFCLCWANENWTRRWDGRESEILIGQAHSEEDDLAVIRDLMRYMRSDRYIRVEGKPILLIYRVSLFPDIAATAERWREACRREGLGEIYLVAVESHYDISKPTDPLSFGFDAIAEFPPHGRATMADEAKVVEPEFNGVLYDYPALVRTYVERPLPGYPLFRGVIPRWDNTARRQNDAHVFVNANPGAYRAWLSEVIEQTRRVHHGDAQLVFINSWNEWAEAAHLEPDDLFGYGYLEATRDALEASLLVTD